MAQHNWQMSVSFDGTTQVITDKNQSLNASFDFQVQLRAVSVIVPKTIQFYYLIY